MRIPPTWRRPGRLLLAALVVVLLTASVVTALALPVRHAAARPQAGARPAATSPGPSASTAAQPSARPQPAAVTSLRGLSARQLAGQRVIYSYPGLIPPASLLSAIRHGEAAGVIFFGENIASEARLAGVIRQLDAADASPANPVRAPLLLMTDQEGGTVSRLPGAPQMSERQIGESADPAAQATAAGRGAAANLSGVGMNVNLAPVLDVYRHPGDFDDHLQRSYSMNPSDAAGLAADFIRAQQARGVAATAKHFPGLGAAGANQDTDNMPVSLNLPAATIRGVDELPYKAAIAANVKLIMVSWAAYPRLAAMPAGLSPAIVQGELRQRLGFTGVTITDALEAGALRAYGPLRDRALLAARAGMDVLLCSGKYVAEGTDAVTALANGYSSGALPRAAFDSSVMRVLTLRDSLPQ